MPADVAPLIVTLELDPAAQAGFDRQRAELFPAGRTVIGAHLTLFHAVPGSREQAVTADLSAAADRPPFDVEVTGLMSLGGGVAYRLASPTLDRLQRDLQQRWWDGLTRQDQQAFRAHITVQNKVTADRARATMAELQAGFARRSVAARGLRLWRYDGGPWTQRADFPFVTT